MRDLHTSAAGTVQTTVCTPIDILPRGVDVGENVAATGTRVAVHARHDVNVRGRDVRCVSFAEGLRAAIFLVYNDETACIDVLEYSVMIEQKVPRSRGLTRVTA